MQEPDDTLEEQLLAEVQANDLEVPAVGEDVGLPELLPTLEMMDAVFADNES